MVNTVVFTCFYQYIVFLQSMFECFKKTVVLEDAQHWIRIYFPVQTEREKHNKVCSGRDVVPKPLMVKSLHVTKWSTYEPIDAICDKKTNKLKATNIFMNWT